MISLKNVTFSFGESQILENVNLDITPGTIHSLIGSTGAGKTLILKLIAGLIPLQSGSILNPRTNISFVFQQNALFPWMTVKENLILTTGKNSDEINLFLKNFNLDSYLEHYPNQLSGGTLQKFNLIRAFLNGGNLVLLDEPFTHLDLIQKEELYLFLIELWKKHSPTIILVTHDIDEALFLSHHVSFLSKKERRIQYYSNVNDLGTSYDIALKDFRLKPNIQKVFNELYSQLKSDLR